MPLTTAPLVGIDDQKQEKAAESELPVLPSMVGGNADVPLDVHLLDFERTPATAPEKRESSPFDLPSMSEMSFDKFST